MVTVNYSWLERKLHKLALSTKTVRMMTFEMERLTTRIDNPDVQPVFIAGLARSGSTALFNAIYESSQFSSPTYLDMPFVLAPNFWSKFHFRQERLVSRERAHGDGLQVSIYSPEAFEEVFWNTFESEPAELVDNFAIYRSVYNKKYGKLRYLSKNNQNIKRLSFISEIVPDCHILIPFREPLQHCYSLLVQHQKFKDFAKLDRFIHEYISLIGHSEFGSNYQPIFDMDLNYRDPGDINHWIEQWVKVYTHCYEVLREKDNISFVCYEKLCATPKYWGEIQDKIRLNHKNHFEFRNSLKTFDMKINNNLMKKAEYVYNEICKIL
jgi:hypothetical protein